MVRICCLPHDACLISRKYQDFENPSRTDALRLQHWTKSQEGADAEGKLGNTLCEGLIVSAVRFAQFNKAVDVVEYTEEEYEEHLQGRS